MEKEQLHKMLDLRAKAFSRGNILSIREIFSDNLSFTDSMPIEEVLSVFAGFSPRAMLTLVNFMTEEQLNAINHGSQDLSKIGDSAFNAGLQRFCNDVAHRNIPDEKACREITSINRIVFTSKTLHSEVFRGHTPQSVRSKLGKWKKLEVFTTIGSELSGKQGFPTEIHAFSDPSIAFLAVNLPLDQFLQDKVRHCPNCGAVLLRDFEKGGSFQCKECHTSFELAKTTTKEHEERQDRIRSVARDAARTISDPKDIRALCKAANVDLGDETYVGSPFLIWIRVLQFLDESNANGFRSLLETLDEALPSESKAKQEVIPELYYVSRS